MSFRPDSPFVDEVHLSPNVGPRKDGHRPNVLIVHYTGLESVERSIQVLADPVCAVSCHYVVDTDGRVTQMVAEAQRAWHAGVSYWQGETDLNSMSIGIEVQNPGHSAGYPDFPDAQMLAIERLAGDIVGRHDIRPERVLAHSDIAPQRKCDPGEKFDWARLAHTGIGYWQPPAPPDTEVADPGELDADASVARAQQLLAAYGYEVAADGRLDARTRKVVAAFQRHFRPARVDGLVDRSTIATLERLLAGLNRAAGVS